MKNRLSFFAIVLFFLEPCVAQENRVSIDSVQYLYVFNGAMYEVYNLRKFESDSVGVSSELASKENRYSITALTDGDHQTAWVEGKDDYGIGEKIRFRLSSLPDYIAILPGYYKSENLWWKNGRVSELIIRFLSANNEGPIDELKLRLSKDESNRIPPAFQHIYLSDLYEQNMEYEDFLGVEIEIADIDSVGARYSDTCISEIMFFQKSRFLGTLGYDDYKSGKRYRKE